MFGWFRRKPRKEIQIPDLLPGGRPERVQQIRDYRKRAATEKSIGNDLVAACLLDYANALERSLRSD